MGRAKPGQDPVMVAYGFFAVGMIVGAVVLIVMGLWMNNLVYVVLAPLAAFALIVAGAALLALNPERRRTARSRR